MAPIISVRNLSKSFGDFKALEGLNLEVPEGIIYGLIGPNGAGKTTLINLLLGFLKADDGSEIQVLGHKLPTQARKVYADIGYMPQDLCLYNELSIKQNLEYFGKLLGISKKMLKTRIPEVLKIVDLAEFEDRTIQNCSGGMKRRASLAVALLHNPKLLILDEPTVGVDPSLRREFWKYFKKITEEGRTVFITTHYLAESVNCDIVGLIRKRIVKEGRPSDLRKQVMDELGLEKLPSMEDVFLYFTGNVDEIKRSHEETAVSGV